ncbi:MAG: nuclear transport factor 2 family protein [Flavobacteriaceae bacterium TMED120]|nr:MAG: nuclear transport factor 2 family protein [Flavobacteriaceae bacterium TMED120]|tara:strand:+ start:487 stop:966 length:480 start_codon:yes stop_codon:yes gene_type:complete
MKKLIVLFLITTPFALFAQKSAGLMSQTDDLSKMVDKMHDAYQSQNFALWDEMITDDAVIYLNNTKIDGKTMKPLFASHHEIFSDIKIEDRYAHTNYFKGGDTWTNSWFTWEGTGNKTGIRYANVVHLDWKWEDGKVVRMQFYYDATGLNLETGAIELN